MKTIRFLVLLLGLALLASGCGGPTLEERDNRRALDAILTAITIQNARLLEESASGPQFVMTQANSPTNSTKVWKHSSTRPAQETGRALKTMPMSSARNIPSSRRATEKSGGPNWCRPKSSCLERPAGCYCNSSSAQIDC